MTATTPIGHVVSRMSDWLEHFSGRDIADLDDTALGAAALRLPAFAADVAEAFEKAGLPYPETTVATLLAWGRRCEAEVDRRLAAASAAAEC